MMAKEKRKTDQRPVWMKRPLIALVITGVLLAAGWYAFVYIVPVSPASQQIVETRMGMPIPDAAMDVRTHHYAMLQGKTTLATFALPPDEMTAFVESLCVESANARMVSPSSGSPNVASWWDPPETAEVYGICHSRSGAYTLILLDESQTDRSTIWISW